MIVPTVDPASDANHGLIGSMSDRCNLSATVLLLLLVAALTAPVGCYNAEALLESQRAEALLTKLEEVDLGQYRVSLPSRRGGIANTEIQFHLFGQVRYKDLPGVEAAIEEQRATISHELLFSIRELPTKEFEDADLTQLRENIKAVVNSRIEGKPVQMVGFYDMLIVKN